MINKTKKEMLDTAFNNSEDNKKIKKENGLISILKGIAPYLIIIIGIWILCNKIVEISVIPSSSMEPTLRVGDITIGLRTNVKAYKRGDIIVFQSDELGELLCKRIIGVGGDTIQFQDGYVFLNGELLDESKYLDTEVETNCMQTFTVPEGTVFVMGDNRENSYDARYWTQPYIDISKITSISYITIPTHPWLGKNK